MFIHFISEIAFQSLLHAITVIKSKVYKNFQLMLQFILVGFFFLKPQTQII